MRTLTLVVVFGLLAGPATGDDPPKKLTPEERKDLAGKLQELNSASAKAYQSGRADEAIRVCEQALEVARKYYSQTEYPDGHTDLAVCMNNLALLYKLQGRLAAAEPLIREGLAIRKKLFTGDHAALAQSLNELGGLYYVQGKLTDAEPLFRDVLAMRKRLFPGDHPAVTESLNNLAAVYDRLGRRAEAEPLFKDALAMNRRLFKGDHSIVAQALNNLAFVYYTQGRVSDAEPLHAEALAMRRRLFKGDHPFVAQSLHNLASVYVRQGKWAEAEPLYKDALAMRKRLNKGDHPDTAATLHAFAQLYDEQKKRAESEPLLKDSVAMFQRLYKGDHPDLAVALNSLAVVYRTQGKLAEAEPLYIEALAMKRRLFKGDHPDVVSCLNNLAFLYRAQGKLAEAGPLYTESLAMQRRLLVGYARQKSEGSALTFAAAQPLSRDALLSLARVRVAAGGYDPASTYPLVWAAKGAVTRVYEQRQLRARAATDDTALAKLLSDLADARRRRAELLVALRTKDPATLKLREEEVKECEQAIADLDGKLHKLLPAVERAELLDRATSADLQKALPADVAIVDYLRYQHVVEVKPGVGAETRTIDYLAFVVTRDKVTWVDLDTAASIETAISHWREAITTPNTPLPADLPKRVRELVWEKVRKELPASTKTVYICPDAALCRVPWAALPGDKPGTILLEDFALATVPHAPFLLDKLWPQDPLKHPPSGVLAVGGVKYDTQVAANATGPSAPGPLVKADAKLGWEFLTATTGEAIGVASLAQRKKFPIVQLDGDKATAAAVLAALPKAKSAHFATHGFFADPSFRGLFQLDEKDYEMSRRGERVGRAVNSPLVMTGLVFAGANDPKTPGRGIVTGESLVDLDLSGLNLAVLSACETGLGDVAGGEGTFGLQRAFHLAGTRDVVASLWKVPDAATAALMGEFYKALWDENLPPVQALQKAQLAVYRADPTQFKAMALRGPGFGDKNFDSAKALTQVTVNASGKNSPLLWAAFTLSGPGR